MSKENKSTIPLNNIDIPPLWSLSRLIDIVSSEKNSLKRGPFGSTIKKSFFVPKGYKVYEQKNAIYSDSTLGNYYIDKKKFEDLLDFQVNPGDFIISCSGTIGKISQLPANAELGIINQALLKIKIDERVILPKYFLYLFRSVEFQKKILKDARGSAMKNIASVKDLKTTPILLPPITDQKRIVAEIEKQFSRLDEAVDNLKRVKANLKRYKASVLKAAVEGKLTEEWRKNHLDVESVEVLLNTVEAEKEKYFQKRLVEWEKISKEAKDKGKKAPVRPRKQKKLPPFSDDEHMALSKLPIGWRWVKNENYAFEVKDGTHDTPKYIEKGIPFATQKNIRENGFILENIKYISIKDHEKFYKRSNVEKNDILISMIGHNRGMSCIVNTDLLFSIKNVGLVKLITEMQSNKYLLYYYHSKLGQDMILKKSKGGAQQFIGLTELRNWPVPICSLVEQKEIVRCVEGLISVVEKVDKQIDHDLQRADRLRQSILKKALTGKL